MQSRVFSISLLVMLLSRLSSAEEYFVAPKGNDDGPGTSAAPWATIQKAADDLSPGDTVTIRPGVYAEAVEVNVSGEPNAWITFKAEPGAILDGSKLTDRAYMWEMTDQSYVRLIGLEIRNLKRSDEASAVRIEGAGSHLEVRNCRIHHILGTNAMGITVYGTNAKKPLSDLIIEGCVIENCEPAPSEALTLNGNVMKFQITGNTIRDINNIGIDMIGGESDIVKGAGLVARDGICRKNRVERARSSYEGGWAAGIYVDGGKNILIEDNEVTACDMGIEVGCENKGIIASQITVKNNRLWSNDKAGIAIGGYDRGTGSVEKCLITENKLWHNAGHAKAMAEIWVQKATACQIIRNSIHGGPGGRLLLVDPLAGINTIAPNIWFSQAAPDKLSFALSGKVLRSLAALEEAADLQKGSLFTDPFFPAPHEGKFNAE